MEETNTSREKPQSLPRCIKKPEVDNSRYSADSFPAKQRNGFSCNLWGNSLLICVAIDKATESGHPGRSHKRPNGSTVTRK
jgi:hypothetical protein